MAEKIQDKFVVFKKADVAAAEKQFPFIANTMTIIQDAVSAHRINEGKPANNRYIVCNEDEPYAQSVWDVILSGEDGMDELTALRASHNALRKEVAWLMECLDAWLYTRRGVSWYAEMEAKKFWVLARAEVDRLLEENDV